MSKTPEAYGNTNGRQRLRPWLVHKINSGTIKGLEWMDEEKLMFKIPWKHAGKQDYDPEEDSRIFKEWSLHTGKYKITMEPEPAVWKTRLRTALNKLPDIEEVQDKTQLDIPEPYRVYRLLPRQKKPSSMPLTQRNNGCRSQVYHPYQRLDQTNQHPSRLSQMRHSMGYNRPNNVHTGYPTSYIMPGIDQMTPPGNSNDIFYDFQPQISQVFSPTSVGGLNIEDVNDVITPRLDPYMSDYDQMSAGSSSPNMDPEPQYQNNQLTQFNYTQGGIIASQPTMTSLQSRTYGGGYQHQTNNVYTTQAQGCAPTTAVGMTSSPAYNQTYHQQTHNAMVPYSGGMRAVDDIWPGTTVPVREDNMIMKTEKEMDIKVRYRGETVIDKRVGDCCIYSKTMLPGLELLTPIELPDSQTVEYKVLKPSEKQKEHTNTVIDSMLKGLIFEYDQSDRSLYVTRHCKGKVFCQSTQFHIGQSVITLEKEKRFKIFDYNKFDCDFYQWYKEDYLSGSRMPIQKPEIFFSVAQKWQPPCAVLDEDASSSADNGLVLDDCLLSIIIQPVSANENIEAVDKKNLSDQTPTGVKMKHLLYSNDDQQFVSDNSNVQYANGYYPQYRPYDAYNNGSQPVTPSNNTHVQQHVITQLTP